MKILCTADLHYRLPHYDWLVNAADGVDVVAVAALFLVGRRTAAKEIALLLPNLLILFKDLARDPRLLRRGACVR